MLRVNLGKIPYRPVALYKIRAYSGLMLFVYNLILIFLFAVLLPFLPMVYLVSKKRRQNIIHRMGIYTDIVPWKSEKKRIWIHALSVGEVRSALPLVDMLKTMHPESDIVFTITTKTGFDTAKSLFSQKSYLRAIQIAYFPFDLIFSVKRVVSLINPDLVLLVESDVWPNFLWVLNRKKIPVCLVNARMSKRSHKGYCRFQFFFKKVFSCFAIIFAQTETDAKRFVNLGIPREKIQISGNIKFDQKPPFCSRERLASWQNLLNLSEKNRVVIAGSTHPGEEKILADFYKAIKKKYPWIVLILAPRDPERAGMIANDYVKMGIHVALLTDIEKGLKPKQVVIVDKMGVLAEMYALSHVAFVGGSMLPFGGHNPLEPACFYKPVLFGPNMSDFADIAEMLISKKGALIVHDAEDLCRAVHILMSDDTIRKKMGDNAAQVFYTNNGAAFCIVNGLQKVVTL